LQEHGCPWDFDDVCVAAAKGGSEDAMAYLHLQQHADIAFNAETLTEMLNAACALHKLAAAQLLRQQGAEWPESLNYDGIAWSGALLQWVRSAGCTSPIE
jgi:hypothetical protein